MKIQVPYPPWRTCWLALLCSIFLLGIQTAALAQSKAELSLEFKSALAQLPGPNEMGDLPPDSRTQLRDTRDLYAEGTHIEDMSTTELAQFSLRLKANTALAQQLLKVLVGKSCIQGCVLKRRSCQKDCPRPAGFACKCCLHCNLLLDLCVTNCLLQSQSLNGSAPAN